MDIINGAFPLRCSARSLPLVLYLVTEKHALLD